MSIKLKLLIIGAVMATTKAIKVYTAKDGLQFNTAKEADQYDAENDFINWYETSTADVDLWGSTGQSRVDVRDLISWLKANRDIVQDLYKNIK